MSHFPVSWNEGMFLRPHHFQASDRYWNDQLARSVAWTAPFSYGIHAVSFSEDALAAGQFELTSISLRLRDGSLVELAQELDRLNLKSAFDSRETVRVCLAVPRVRQGTRNVTANGEVGLRYQGVSLDVADENFGGNEQNVDFKKLAVKVCLDSEDLTGYEMLPIAQIKRTDGRDGSPVLDKEYAPPLLNINCWPDLARDVIRSAHDLMVEKIETVAQQVLARGITLGSGDPGDLERVFMMQVLNEGIAALGAMVTVGQIHPFPVFVEMSRIVGALSIFGTARRVPELPTYDHDDLMFVFRTLREHIRTLLTSVTKYEFEQRFFVGAGPGMAVALDEKWLGADYEWYVGVRSSSPNAQVQALLQPGRLDWKMGSADEVDRLFRGKYPGLALRPVRHHPRALPPDGEWLYFQVDKIGAAWERVVQTRELGMRFQQSLITNRDALEGQRVLKVAGGDGAISLEIALFAVPQHTGLNPGR